MYTAGQVKTVPLLPQFLEQQQRIVIKIEKLAQKIEEANRLRVFACNRLDLLAMAALSKLFDYEDSSPLPNNWKWMQFSQLLCDPDSGMITGPFGTLLQKAEVTMSGVPILGIQNVGFNRFIPGFSSFVTPEKAEQLSLYRLNAGDIVVARSGTVGRSCIVPKDLDPEPLMSTNLMGIRLNSKLFLPELLSRLFNGSTMIERHKYNECRGSSRTFFTQKIWV